MKWITCENTYEESWRLLLEFANVELAVEAISALHGEPDKKSRPNYLKQAEQVRVALLQAKEYFEAARASSLYTKPNHLYYGTVALSTACMLIRGDGSHSLDALRKDKTNASHGLQFNFSSDAKLSRVGTSLLDNSYIRICPNGHFSNWYKTLSPTQNVHALLERSICGTSRNSVRMNAVGSFQIPSYEELSGIKESLSFAVKRLPDLVVDLARYGIKVDCAIGEHKQYKNSVHEIHDFIFHSSTGHEALLKIISQFRCDDGVYFSYDINHDENNGRVTTREDKGWPFSFPDSRSTLDHKTVYYSGAMNTPEVVDLFIISFALSMLSRYYPDVWVSFIESHCKGAKLVEQIVRILMLKLPNLMLNQITGDTFIISHHRPTWL